MVTARTSKLALTSLFQGYSDVTDGGRCPADAPLLSLVMSRVEDFIDSEFLQVLRVLALQLEALVVAFFSHMLFCCEVWPLLDAHQFHASFMREHKQIIGD